LGGSKTTRKVEKLEGERPTGGKTARKSEVMQYIGKKNARHEKV
jgi:hypothetical protein